MNKCLTCTSLIQTETSDQCLFTMEKVSTIDSESCGAYSPDRETMWKKIAELEEKLEVAEKLLKILHSSNNKALDTPLYSLNPSYQQMSCVNGFVNGADIKDIKDKLKRNGYWDE